MPPRLPPRESHHQGPKTSGSEVARVAIRLRLSSDRLHPRPAGPGREGVGMGLSREERPAARQDGRASGREGLTSGRA